MTELVVREHVVPAPTQLTNEQLKFIASTEFVPPQLRGNLPAILACVATGRELGIGDMQALRAIHIIDGKPSFSAELMVQRVRKNGHSIVGEVEEGKARVTGRRADNGDEMTVMWTLAMAERAGLVGKQNWKKYPEAMLWARAVSQLCRMLFADCFAGATYTTEELGADDTDQYGGAPYDPAAGTPFGDPEDVIEGSLGAPEEPMSSVADSASVSPAHEEPAAPSDEPFISDKQRRLLFATAKDRGLDQAAIKAILREQTGQESSKAITRDVFDGVLAAVERAGTPA
jgi:hypothetical protein